MSRTSLASRHSTILFFLFLSLSGFSHWITVYPGPLHHGQSGWGPGSWPGPADLQHGGCGHWEGRCSTPTHPAAFSTLPCEYLPPLCAPWLTVYDPGFLVGHHKTHLAPSCLYASNSHGMFSRQSSLLHPQLPSFQNAVAPPFFFGPLVSGSIALNWGERPF